MLHLNVSCQKQQKPHLEAPPPCCVRPRITGNNGDASFAANVKLAPKYNSKQQAHTFFHQFKPAFAYYMISTGLQVEVIAEAGHS